MAAVPDTTTFNLQDVIDAVSGTTTNDLVECFAEAESDAFDATYSGSKNNLLNFRNYEEITDSVYTIPTELSYDYSETQYVAVNSSDSWTAAVYFDRWDIISSVTPSGTTGERCYITVDSQEGFASATIRVTRGTAYADVSVSLSQ